MVTSRGTLVGGWEPSIVVDLSSVSEDPDDDDKGEWLRLPGAACEDEAGGKAGGAEVAGSATAKAAAKTIGTS